MREQNYQSDHHVLFVTRMCPVVYLLALDYKSLTNRGAEFMFKMFE